jgi:hypothetical protein
MSRGETGAVQVITNLASLIQSNATNPAAVTELATKLKASADALGAAIVANTPHADDTLDPSQAAPADEGPVVNPTKT